MKIMYTDKKMVAHEGDKQQLPAGKKVSPTTRHRCESASNHGVNSSSPIIKSFAELKSRRSEHQYLLNTQTDVYDLAIEKKILRSLRKKFGPVVTRVHLRFGKETLFVEGEVDYPSQRAAIGLWVKEDSRLKCICNLLKLTPPLA